MTRTVRMTCIGTVAGIGSQRNKEQATLLPIDITSLVQEVKITVPKGTFKQGKHYDWPCVGVLANLIEGVIPVEHSVEDTAYDSEKGILTSEDQKKLEKKVGGRPIGRNTIVICTLLGRNPNGLHIGKIVIVTGFQYHIVAGILNHHRGSLFTKNGENDWTLIERKEDERQEDGLCEDGSEDQVSPNPRSNGYGLPRVPKVSQEVRGRPVYTG